MPNQINPNAFHIKGFWFAGAYNVFGMLLFSKFFTNSTLSAIDPNVFSWLGQIAIILWGFAYWSVARSYQHVPLLIVVFAVEKLIYSLTWFTWLITNGSTIPSIAEESLLTAVFYSVYGAGDFTFFIFFSLVALNVHKNRARSLA